ncbi:hypothetical protein SAMN05216375_12034 [Trichococcus ilyis]|uniref:Uncharacterized protein n=1 Tax=Trichococcus ilyis TaxID=640938 RepID=A0A143Z3K2_9LACT|nr:Hypothetical protein TR210_2303 [Trichococcus ilyis]SEJ64215.1 hypothetical protein SAMN05216375_12034 [Trichococcus ilyis]
MNEKRKMHRLIIEAGCIFLYFCCESIKYFESKSASPEVFDTFTNILRIQNAVQLHG